MPKPHFETLGFLDATFSACNCCAQTELSLPQRLILRRIGVTDVPFYLINKKYALTGAQPTELFVQALNQVIAEDEKAEG